MTVTRLYSTVVFVVLALLLAACQRDSETPQPGTTPSPGETPPPGETATPTQPSLRNVVLSAHRFVPVGESTSVAGLGIVLEAVSLDEGAITYNEADATVTCNQGGRGFVRVRYREAAPTGKNEIQTVAVVCIDELGDCTGLTRVSYDFERYLDQEPKGEADYLAQGDGRLYGVCLSEQGSYRLQQPPPMPPLMFRVIDALGDGPYSLADYDFPIMRGAILDSYSGQTWSPSWFSAVSRELPEIAIHADGSVSISGPVDCETVPSCTNDPALVQPGDFLSIGFGVPGNVGLSGVLEAAGAETIDDFVASHIDLELSTDMAEVFPEARNMVVFRLIGMQVEKQMLDYFDGLYGLKNSGVRIAVDPYWEARGYVPNQCHPDSHVICDEVEAKLAAYERATIAEWQSEGYSLWYADFLAYGHEGEYTPRAQIAPAYDAFEGVILVMDVGRPISVGDKPQVLANAVRSLAEDLGPGMPVVLSLHWGAMQFVVDGVFCEADVCTSAFSNFYSAYEPALAAMLESFAPGQLEAFGVSLFEGGSHFDIREPYETKGGFPLNRVGETGFNNPVMNLYLTQ